LPRRRRAGIPLGEAPALAFPLRRTTIVRIVLGAALVALAVFAVWRAASLNPQPVAFLPQNATTIVVVDQSKSIYAAAYKRIAQAFRRLVAADVPIGLVAFSDTAYEMLPPEARSTDLEPMLRFYVPTKTGQNVDPETSFPASPWDNVFSAGTKISSGLNMALAMIRRDHVKHPTILLASDLQTAEEDQTALATTLSQIEQDKQVSLRLLPLFPLPADRQFFASFVPSRDFLKPSQIQGPVATSSRTGVIGSTPWPLLVVAGLLLLALAANELLCARVLVPATVEDSR
jgi:hypothetical protein